MPRSVDVCTYCSLPHAFTSELKPSHYHSGLKFGEIGSTLQLALECNHSPQQKLYFVGGMLTQTLSVFHWGVTAKHQIRTRTQKQNLNSFLTSLFKTAFIYIFFLFFFFFTAPGISGTMLSSYFLVANSRVFGF